MYFFGSVKLKKNLKYLIFLMKFVDKLKSVQVAKKHLATDIEKFATTATVTCLVCVGILVTFF
jgi:hypothetical protein